MEKGLRQKILNIIHKEGMDAPEIHDIRQKIFSTVAKKIKNEDSSAKIINVVKGYPVSAVNLGHIHKVMLVLIEKHNIYSKEAMIIVLEEFIQRLKSINITRHKAIYGKKKEYHEEWYDIKFETKDDYNWYNYSFLVTIKQSGPSPKTRLKIKNAGMLCGPDNLFRVY